MSTQEQVNREMAISREEHFASYGAALFKIYFEAPQLKDLECHLGDGGRHATLYATDERGDVLAVASFDLEHECTEDEFDEWPYIEGFASRTAVHRI